MVTPIAEYDQFADEYAQYPLRDTPGSFNFNLDVVIPRLLEVAGRVDGLSVLDAGCGEGIVSRSLVGAPARVVGIDISHGLIDYARMRDQTITYEVHDLCRPLPQYANTFDLIVSNLVLNDLPDHVGSLTTLSSVLKPRGRIVLSMNNPYSAVFREKVTSYFDSGAATQYNFGPITYFHRTMEDYLHACQSLGLLLRGLYDVQMAEAMVAQLPDRNRDFPWYSLYHRFPFFIVIELVKLHA
jgi:2-polyprenyl-3-methyl-5-hydroxy-6-metoxy-1,4-benzoquinol methylase